jgi:DNA-binding phage protein
MNVKLTDFNEVLAKDLKDPDFAAAYLEECLSFDEPETFVLALRDVLRANDVNTEPKTLRSILETVGLRLTVTPILKAA